MQPGGSFNPYATPASDGLDRLASPATEGGAIDATRGARFGAALIDAVSGMLVILPMQFALGVWKDFPAVKMSFGQTVAWTVGAFAIFVAMHGYFLVRGAQTIGKRLVGIQIVNVTDLAPAPVSRILLLRYLPTNLVTLIPVVGGFVHLVDTLAIFREDRRCVHDHIAGTRVVVKRAP
jgi:uncharacterized RDD family membrane protein YckC